MPSTASGANLRATRAARTNRRDLLAASGAACASRNSSATRSCQESAFDCASSRHALASSFWPCDEAIALAYVATARS